MNRQIYDEFMSTGAVPAGPLDPRASIAPRTLTAGLLEIHLIPVLFGDGRRHKGLPVSQNPPAE